MKTKTILSNLELKITELINLLEYFKEKSIRDEAQKKAVNAEIMRELEKGL